MMHLLYMLILILLGTTQSWAQVINFTDGQLKQYLIHKKCVDTSYNGLAFSNDVSVDRNGDEEIQLTEALAVQFLDLNDFSDNYAIQSLLDLNAFANLSYLKIIAHDSLKRIEHLSLDSLKTLWISDGVSLGYIDLSNLPNLTTTLRIEGLTRLDTLNIQNGTSANQFSLFYTQNIKYACIDSIANEINEFSNSGAMSVGLAPSFDCSLLTTTTISQPLSQLRIYPNPTEKYFSIDVEQLDKVSIFNLVGQELLTSHQKTVDVSTLPNGLYIIICTIGDQLVTRRLCIQ